MIEPEVTGSGVEDGADDDEGVMLGAVKVNVGSDWDLGGGESDYLVQKMTILHHRLGWGVIYLVSELQCNELYDPGAARSYSCTCCVLSV